MMLLLPRHRAATAGLQAAALLLLLAAAPAFAQPSRIDNIWNGRDHEPNPQTVHEREKADGLLPPGTAQRETRTTDELARELLKGEPSAAPPR